MQNKLYQCTCSNKFNNKLLNGLLSPKSIDKTSINNRNSYSDKVAKKFDPWQRLYDTHTNSFKMKTVSRKIYRYQGDELDFVFSSVYQQNTETFANKCDVYFQPKTLATVKKKRGDAAKTTKKVTKQSAFDSQSLTHIDRPEDMHKPAFDDHPLIIGGITDRIHASSIKLMNSSHHSPQTNAGYVRQDRDGNLFQY